LQSDYLSIEPKRTVGFMRLLIYGFGPYGEFENNVTKKILRKLPNRSWLKKVVFTVRFHRGQFIDAIERYKPDVILGLGQCSKGRLLRIEKGALNQRRNNQRIKARPILRRGVHRFLTNLPLKLGRQARSSNNAGDYVCNYSMYVILDYLERRGLSIPYGFIHIPSRYDPIKASRILEKAIGRINPVSLVR
jgi:pyroglutamyl-peptidase